MILQLSQHSTSSTAVSWLAEEMNPPYHVSQKGKFPENRADIFATEASTLALPGEDAQNIIEIEILGAWNLERDIKSPLIQSPHVIDKVGPRENDDALKKKKIGLCLAVLFVFHDLPCTQLTNFSRFH